mgnify:CR=1 FL=1
MSECLDTITSQIHHATAGTYHLPIETSVKVLLTNRADSSGRILLLQEPGGRYHFPGGVATPTEQPKDTLKRELGEETPFSLDTLVIDDQLEYSCSWPGKFGNKIVGIFFICSIDTPVEALEQQLDTKLSAEEHISRVLANPRTACEDYNMVSSSDEIIAAYLNAITPEVVH